MIDISGILSGLCDKRLGGGRSGVGSSVARGSFEVGMRCSGSAKERIGR